MRIIHIVRQFHPAIGGLENVVRDLGMAQVKNGHQVRVVTLNRMFNDPARLLPEREMLHGIEIVRIPFKGSKRYPFAPQVLKHIRDADLLHVHAIDFFFDFLALTAPWHRKPMVLSPHGAFFHTKFAARLKALYFNTVTRLSLTFYRSVICLSEHDYELFGKLRSRGITWWDYGIDTGKFRDAASRQPAKSIVTLSRFSVNKRIDRLIAFMAALRRRDPEWTLVIAGVEWDYTADKIRQMANEAGIGEACEVLARAPDEILSAKMGSSSLFASASEYEAFGIAPLEGLSAGLIPLLSDIHSYKHVVDHAGLGLNVDFERTEEAVDRFLAYWLQVVQHYDALRAKAIEAAKPFDWTSVARRFDPVYEAALGRGARCILGVPIKVATRESAVRELDERLERGAPPALIAYANAHMLNIASKDERFKAILNRSLVYNDGIGVDIASRLLFGKAFPENLNGTDFTPYYLSKTRYALRIFFLGAKPGIAEKAASKLLAMNPSLEIAGTEHGFTLESDMPALIERIRRSEADVILVAMGNPAQEIWLDAHLQETGCRLGFAVGALFDFLSQAVPRAPEHIRGLRLEWAYRLAQEPGRLWRRYLIGNGAFLLRALSQWGAGART